MGLLLEHQPGRVDRHQRLKGSVGLADRLAIGLFAITVAPSPGNGQKQTDG